MKDLILNGQSLTVDSLARFVASPDAHISLDQGALETVKKTRAFLEAEIDKKIIYGVNTGFGPMSTFIISPEQAVELQNNLIRSHASGVGEPIPDHYVLATMVVRLNTLLRGHSGVSAELLEHLRDLINARVIPIIPEHGAVGTSGDLLQLAHIAHVLIGRGEVHFEGVRMTTEEAFKKVKLSAYSLKPKEGLSLINGTSAMAAIMSLVLVEAETLFDVATRTGAYGLEVVSAFSDGFSSELSATRPHKGQLKIMKALQDLTKDSKRIRERYSALQPIADVAKNGDSVDIKAYVQEVYSLRCIPQILGPLIETLCAARETIEIEINSTTDNPVISLENHAIFHGGNFHGEYIAVAADQVKAALVKLSILTERRTNFFLSSHVNRFLPQFLNRGTLGLNLGLQALQFTSTSTTAHSQSLAYPHSIHSISTNGDNQDVVSMGTDAALFCAKVLDNTKIVLAIEMVTLAQATDCLTAAKELSMEASKLYTYTRSLIPELIEDRSLSKEVTTLSKSFAAEESLRLAELFDRKS